MDQSPSGEAPPYARLGQQARWSRPERQHKTPFRAHGTGSSRRAHSRCSLFARSESGPSRVRPEGTPAALGRASPPGTHAAPCASRRTSEGAQRVAISHQMSRRKSDGARVMSLALRRRDRRHVPALPVTSRAAGGTAAPAFRRLVPPAADRPAGRHDCYCLSPLSRAQLPSARLASLAAPGSSSPRSTPSSASHAVLAVSAITARRVRAAPPAG